MPFSINRIVGLEELLRRPRISYKVSEYVFNYINEKILKPANILQSDKYIFDFTLSFNFGIPINNKIIYKSPFSTKKRIFVSHKGFTVFEKTTKRAHLTVITDDIDQNIEPIEYANVVYDMFADYLLYNYKKLKKEIFDEIKNQLDYSIINSFPFPAPFEEQKYIADDSKYMKNWDDFVSKRQEKWTVIKDEYLNHYNF